MLLLVIHIMELGRKLKNFTRGKPASSSSTTPKISENRVHPNEIGSEKNTAPKLSIEFLRSSRNGETIEVPGAVGWIGTAPKCEILFDFILDHEVGPHHATIALEAGKYWIIPRTEYYTWLNQEALKNKHELQHGDTLTLGSAYGPEVKIVLQAGHATPTKSIPVVHVRVEKGEAHKKWERFERDFTLGRSKDCDLQFTEPQVSMHHARVIWDGERWLVEDLESRNGTFLNGVRIKRTDLPNEARLELTPGGPVIVCEIEPGQTHEADKKFNETMQQYFGDGMPQQVSEQTVLIQQSLRQIQRKHAERYWIIIGTILIMLVMTISALYFQGKRVQRQDELRVLAENVFYTMKALELQMATLQAAVAQHPDSLLQKQFEEKLQEQRQLQTSYSNFARDELGISRDRLSEEEWLIYKIARIFGECDVSMPPDFVKTVKKYIRFWQSTKRYQEAMARALANNYAPQIVQALLAHDMPPQFFYLALQETDFDFKRCGPQTAYGIAKGMWQFIPSTGMHYGLQTGPLL